VLTPKTVTETTPVVVAHLKQRDLVRASVLAVPDGNAVSGKKSERG